MTHIIITRSDKGARVSIDGEDIGWGKDLAEAHTLIKEHQAGALEAPVAEAKPKAAPKAKPKAAK